MLHEIVMSGLGGQGALLIGQILAVAGTVEDLNATWMPIYGPEKRGGTAFCDVILSDEPIGSPVVDEPEAVVAMDAASFERFESSIVPGGKMIYNASVCTAAPARADIGYIAVPAGEITHALGSDKVTNMVLLGALLEAYPIVQETSVEAGLREKLGAKKEKLLAMNLEAIRRGGDCAKLQK